MEAAFADHVLTAAILGAVLHEGQKPKQKAA